MGAAEHKAAIAQSRQSALGFADKAGGPRVQKLLQDAAKDLEKRVRAAERTLGKDAYTAVKQRTLLNQIKHSTAQLTKDLKAHVLDQGGKAAELSTTNLLKQIKAADAQFRGVGDSPVQLDEASMMDAAAQGTESSLLSRLSGDPDVGPGILSRYGAQTVATFERQIQLGLLTGKGIDEITEDLIDSSPFLQGQPRFWAERIARTETMGAYNRAGWEGMRQADEELGDAVKIICATFDHRTGPDSYNQHGMIRRMDEAFEYIADNGKRTYYQCPPNRPNDREVVIMHRISWALPPELRALKIDKVVAAYAKEKKKFPGRPKMTTVSLSQFGKPQKRAADEDA
jgi:hypothetical protein